MIQYLALVLKLSIFRRQCKWRNYPACCSCCRSKECLSAIAEMLWGAWILKPSCSPPVVRRSVHCVDASLVSPALLGKTGASPVAELGGFFAEFSGQDQLHSAFMTLKRPKTDAVQHQAFPSACCWGSQFWPHNLNPSNWQYPQFCWWSNIATPCMFIRLLI